MTQASAVASLLRVGIHDGMYIQYPTAGFGWLANFCFFCLVCFRDEALPRCRESWRFHRRLLPGTAAKPFTSYPARQERCSDSPEQEFGYLVATKRSTTIVRSEIYSGHAGDIFDQYIFAECGALLAAAWQMSFAFETRLH